ncbi:hypothetical protein ACJX0J_037091, partial [Zea mays]
LTNYKLGRREEEYVAYPHISIALVFNLAILIILFLAQRDCFEFQNKLAAEGDEDIGNLQDHKLEYDGEEDDAVIHFKLIEILWLQPAPVEPINIAVEVAAYILDHPVHKIAVLDIRLANADRHAGNILVKVHLKFRITYLTRGYFAYAHFVNNIFV